MTGGIGRTSLSEEAYSTALRMAVERVKAAGKITNRDVRSLTGLNYDQAIKFFNQAIVDGILERRGRASATHYTIRPSTKEDD